MPWYGMLSRVTRSMSVLMSQVMQGAERQPALTEHSCGSRHSISQGPGQVMTCETSKTLTSEPGERTIKIEADEAKLTRKLFTVHQTPQNRPQCMSFSHFRIRLRRHSRQVIHTAHQRSRPSFTASWKSMELSPRKLPYYRAYPLQNTGVAVQAAY